MSSEFMEVVDAVARNGSFSAAAQELGQISAVSYTVRQLEEWLAVPLFERRHRDVELARRGLVFTGRALCYQKNTGDHPPAVSANCERLARTVVDRSG